VVDEVHGEAELLAAQHPVAVHVRQDPDPAERCYVNMPARKMKLPTGKMLTSKVMA
jgi:hypothetical protein